MPDRFDTIKWGVIRRQIDDRMLTIVHSLERAARAWNTGIDFDWHGYNRLPTLRENKKQFNLLHGALWNYYNIVFDREAQRLGIERIRYDKAIDETTGRKLTDDEAAALKLRRLDRSIAWIEDAGLTVTFFDGLWGA